MMKVAVITPTIGNKHLSECVSSVKKQTYQNLTHYLFVDGKNYLDSVTQQIGDDAKISVNMIAENVGKGWYGHRVYAACSFLVNADIIIYLDEDNWIEPDHVEKLVQIINQGNDWAYSLRKIYDKDGSYICDDNCESLGKWPIFLNENAHHIDTSCYAVKRDIATRIGHAWYGQWGADRQFFNALSQYFTKYDCTNSHTLCYRLDGNEGSVKKEFFVEGNFQNYMKYSGNFPWKSQ